jgi:hypothetical protein
MNKNKKPKNFKVGLGADDVKVILVDGIPLSNLIPWNEKKRLLQEVTEETEQDIEYIFQECSKLAGDWRAGFFLSVGGNEWIRKDAWRSPILNRYLLKQLYFISTSDANSGLEKLKDQMYCNALVLDYSPQKAIKKAIKKTYMFLDVLGASFLMSVINLFRINTVDEASLLGCAGRVFSDADSSPEDDRRFNNININFDIRFKNFAKIFNRDKKTGYENISVQDWFDSLKVSARYFIIWNKFKHRANKKRDFYCEIDNSFIGIFCSILHYKVLLGVIKAARAKYVVCSATPNRPSSRRFFLAASEAGVTSITVMPKVMFNSNIGYRLNINKNDCDHYGVANKFLVNTQSSLDTLLLGGVKPSNITLKLSSSSVTDNNDIDVYRASDGNDKNILLLCLTPNSTVNLEMVKVVINLCSHLEVKLLVRSHPLLDFDEQLLFESTDDYINVTELSFDELEKRYCGDNVRSVVVSNFSSSLLKALEFGFMPIWFKSLGETPILFGEIIDVVGKTVNNIYEFQKVLDYYFKSPDFNGVIKREKKKSGIYIGRNIISDDIDDLIYKLEHS